MRPFRQDDRPRAGTFGATTPLGAVIADGVRRHRRLVLGVFLAIMLPGTIVALVKGRPAYVAEATIHVAPRFPKTLEADAEIEGQTRDYQAFLQQQVYLLTRFGVLENALDRMDAPTRALWQAPDVPVSRAVAALGRSIEARAMRDSFLVSVALEGPEPDGLADTVNAVVDAYLHSQKDETFFQPEARIADLRTHRTQVEGQLDGLLAEEAELARRLGVSGFGGAATQPLQAQLDATTAELGVARRALVEARAFRQALDEDGLQVALLPEEEVTGVPATLLERRTELAARLAGLTEAHPGYQAYASQLAETDARVLQSAKDAADARIARADRYVTGLRTELDELKQSAGDQVADHARGVRLAGSIADAQARLGEIDRRLAYLDLESAGPGFARVFSPARTPDSPTRSRRLKYFLAFAALAVASSVCASIGARAMDRTVHSEGDLERALGFPPLALLPAGATDDAAAELADQVRRLSLTVERERRNNGTRVFVVTPTRDDAGTSTLIARVGRELTAMGRAVLSVDAHVGKTVPGNSPPGLVDVLKGATTAATAIIPGTPSHLPVGDSVGYARLPYGHRLADVLGEVSNLYDIVLVEAPPTLRSADAELLAEASQATLLVVNAETDTVDEVKRAIGTLRSASPPLFGAVLQQGGMRLRLSPGAFPAADDDLADDTPLVTAGADDPGSDPRWT